MKDELTLSKSFFIFIILNNEHNTLLKITVLYYMINTSFYKQIPIHFYFQENPITFLADIK